MTSPHFMPMTTARSSGATKATHMHQVKREKALLWWYRNSRLLNGAIYEMAMSKCLHSQICCIKLVLTFSVARLGLSSRPEKIMMDILQHRTCCNRLTRLLTSLNRRRTALPQASSCSTMLWATNVVLTMHCQRKRCQKPQTKAGLTKGLTKDAQQNIRSW